MVIGLVGAVGTDLNAVRVAFEDKFSHIGYAVEHVKLSELLKDLPHLEGELGFTSEFERYQAFMDAGTKLRELTRRGDALAMLAVMAIRDKRREIGGDPRVFLQRHVFLLHSLKHPDEVDSLRKIYGPNFVLVSAYAPEENRFRKLAENLAKSEHVFQGRDKYPEAQQLLQRDEAEPGKALGQQVRKTFPLADVFIDTTDPNEVRKSVVRFVELYFGEPFHTPTRDEYGMSHAQTAANRSSALGRQVGAAVTTEEGDIVVVGTNEVPKAGGGLYWPGDRDDGRDFTTRVDINDKFKHRMLADVLRRLKDEGWLSEEKARSPIEQLVSEILANSASAIGGAQLLNVIEYGRCVHAEMAAIVDAARRGVAVAGCTLYTTTFPCHECARHIVAAGIRRVVYIDPYPKSLVQELHGDSIVLERGDSGGGRVLFRPFVGVAPRLYLRLFQQSKRKDDQGDITRWEPQTAVPRYNESEVAILVREDAEVEKFRKLMDSLKPGTAQPDDPVQTADRRMSGMPSTDGSKESGTKTAT